MRPDMRPGDSRRRSAPGARSRHRWRRQSAVLLTAAVTITSIVGYVSRSFTVSGLPPYPSATRAARRGTQLEDHRHRTFPQLSGVRLP